MFDKELVLRMEILDDILERFQNRYNRSGWWTTCSEIKINSLLTQIIEIYYSRLVDKYLREIFRACKNLFYTSI